MKKALILVIFLVGCAPSQPYEWELKEKTKPLYGCEELRKENPNADC